MELNELEFQSFDEIENPFTVSEENLFPSFSLMGAKKKKKGEEDDDDGNDKDDYYDDDEENEDDDLFGDEPKSKDDLEDDFDIDDLDEDDLFEDDEVPYN